ncbi:DUF2510 domain-containing protein [Streptomyces sp. NPDC057798]|uniref:DUF2510 domain-containing protein n=1 Tax=Streptomyces sp. NPDC057798 TaxID=3346252 RepID=UPI0036A8F77C
MTQVTPPGWYPDPGQTSDGPATERWWDGRAWTDRIRPVGSAAVWGPPTAGTQPDHPAQPAQPAYPAYSAYSAYPAYPAPPPGRRRGVRTGIAVAVAAAVLAAIGVGVYALAGDGGSDGGTADSSPAPGGPGGPGGEDDPFGDPGGPERPSPSPSPEGSEAPRIESGAVTDPISGISLPVPDGWYGQEITVGASVTSEESYKCPGDTSQTCTKGGAYSAPAEALGTKGGTAEAVAKADIGENAEQSYGEGYGRITSHEVLASEAVTVAGQKGYRVRWKAVTSKGADGYVESLAFPSPADSGRIVVVRFGIDVGEKQSVIDEITEGIEPASGGGNGQDV